MKGIFEITETPPDAEEEEQLQKCGYDAFNCHNGCTFASFSGSGSKWVSVKSITVASANSKELEMMSILSGVVAVFFKPFVFQTAKES